MNSYPPQFLSLESLASRVKTGDRIGIGGALFSRLPVALVQEVIRQERKELEYVSWSGGIPMELFLAAGSLRKMIFCFSSLDFFGLAPLFRKTLEAGTVEAEDWTAISLICALRAAQARLPSGIFRPALGSAIYAKSGFTRDVQDVFSGETLAAARSLTLDACLMHASRADTDGNVEILGPQHLDESMLGAARQTLFTVEEIVAAGKLGHVKGSLIWPRKLVSAISVVPGGAFPSSSPGYYLADYREIAKRSAVTPFVVGPTNEKRMAGLEAGEKMTASMVNAPALRLHRKTSPVQGPAEAVELMVHWLSRQFDNSSICSVGAVSPLALTSYLLAKNTHAPGLLILGSNAGCVDPASRPALLSLSEPVDMKSAVHWCGGDHAWFRYYLPGHITHEVVSSAQIDRQGRSNTIEIHTSKGVLRLPGQGGMAEVADVGKNLVFYLPRHTVRNLVESVDFAGVARHFLTATERQSAGLSEGCVRLITNLAVFEVDPVSRQFKITSLHPGVTLEEVRLATGFQVESDGDIPVTVVPDPETLRILREEIDPLGLRFLETAIGPERQTMIESILDAEESLVAELFPTVSPAPPMGRRN